MSIARSKYWATAPNLSSQTVNDTDTSVFDRGGKLVEGALGDVDMLAVAVVGVELLLKFLDPGHDSTNALGLLGGGL